SAFAVGQENLLLLKGTRQFSNWVPGGRFDLSEQARDLLGRLYEQDDLFHASADIAMDLTSAIDMEKLASMSDEDPMDNMMDNMMGDIQKTANRANRAAVLAKFTAERLNEQTRIAAFSIGGWDTHRSQQRNIKRPSAELVDALNVLKQVLGRNWEKTAVVCMTEFGRTVRQNGSAGTDHGTGGAMVLAGGAIRGGQIYGDWPGLGETALYKGRDLMPTGDVREYAAHAIQGLFGTSDTVLENTVFPGLKLTKRPQIVL
ncbi:MAG: twin-arginine translocation pathway signal, partial [Rhodobacteraceae bacterium]